MMKLMIGPHLVTRPQCYSSYIQLGFASDLPDVPVGSKGIMWDVMNVGDGSPKEVKPPPRPIGASLVSQTLLSEAAACAIENQ